MADEEGAHPAPPPNAAPHMDLLNTALAARDAGLAVVPPRMDGSKAPVGEWKQYQNRLPTDDELARWYGPHTGLGVVCGNVSGGLEMLEFEGRAVDAGLWKEYVKLAVEAGVGDVLKRITDGYFVISPSGGYHLMYRCDVIQGNQKLARQRDGDEIQPLIETRGEGGYTITAPTNGSVHPTGKPWKSHRGGYETIATITAEERHELHRLARTFNTYRPEERSEPRLEVVSSDRPGDVYNAQPAAIAECLDLLTNAGWTLVYTRGETHYLRRPGKDRGISATLGAPETGGGFYVFSTSTTWEPERRYSPFHVFAELAHGGDHQRAAKALNQRGVNVDSEPYWQSEVVIPGAETEEAEAIAGIRFLNLREVMTGEFADEQWLVEPVFPKGRQVAIYAQGKTGKSLFVLDICAALASGRPLLGRDAMEPTHVLYIDFEMTPGDLQERLQDLGYGPTDHDFPTLQRHLHYALLQPFHPFDTAAGGQQLEEIVAACGAQLVVVDTLIRSVAGEENSSDTVKDFNRYTGQRLKARGVTLVRVDHAGKDAGRGQRGTSAKQDDVDVVWRLKADMKVDGAEQLRLIKDAARMAWVPDQVLIKRRNAPLRHHLPDEQISEAAATIWWELKRLDAPADLTQNALEQLLRTNGVSGSATYMREAIRWWKRGYSEPTRHADAVADAVGEEDPTR